MDLFGEAMSGFGAVLLPVAAGLLLEELTFGGLVRLILAPRPATRRRGVARDRQPSLAPRRGELNQGKELGGAK
jgi:hypothetical protein